MSNAAGEPKTMTKIKEKFLIDARGRKTAVVVDIGCPVKQLNLSDSFQRRDDLIQHVGAGG